MRGGVHPECNSAMTKKDKRIFEKRKYCILFISMKKSTKKNLKTFSHKEGNNGFKKSIWQN